MPPLNEEEQEKINTFEYQIRRSAAFQRVFSGADGELVKKELAIECKADALLVDYKNPNQTLIIANAAKRDIWTFIQNAMKQDVESARKTLEEHRKALKE